MVAGVLFHKYSRVGLVDFSMCFVHVICIPAGLLSVLLLREVCLQLQLWICLFFFLSILSLVAVCILKLVITNVYIWEGYFFDEFIPLLL